MLCRQRKKRHANRSEPCPFLARSRANCRVAAHGMRHAKKRSSSLATDKRRESLSLRKSRVCIWNHGAKLLRRFNALARASSDRLDIADPQTGVAKRRPLGRNMRSKCRCSMCPAIHINSRSWLRSSSTHEPSDPPPKVVSFRVFRPDRQDAHTEATVM